MGKKPIRAQAMESNRARIWARPHGDQIIFYQSLSNKIMLF
ncbi:MAG: hypothetical protein Q4A98_08760 [Comamonadaceae bacterium]|nr:hypothetical protein [Comamonadaceae bacterium]